MPARDAINARPALGVGADEPTLEKALLRGMQRSDRAVVPGDLAAERGKQRAGLGLGSRGARRRTEHAILGDERARGAQRALKRAVHGIGADVDADIEEL